MLETPQPTKHSSRRWSWTS